MPRLLERLETKRLAALPNPSEQAGAVAVGGNWGVTLPPMASAAYPGGSPTQKKLQFVPTSGYPFFSTALQLA